MSDESIWRTRVLSATMPEYVGELVRCKDCLLYDEDRLTCVRDPFHRGDSLPVEPDNFCSWAEPIEDGDSDGKGQD